MRSFKRRWKLSFSHRILALAMALVATVHMGRAVGDPGDIFSTPAPILGASPPQVADIHVGDSSVSQTGGMTWSYPIQVPPGRNGMEPHLSLTYSSQAPIYGGIAAGWSMDLPMITADPRISRLRRENGNINELYVSSLSGGKHLVYVGFSGSSGFYRANGDSAFLRYEFVTPSAPDQYYWRALALDGTIYEFGGSSAHCANVGPGFAPLTAVTDPFNNRIDYNWTSTQYSSPHQANDCRVSSVTYGANTTSGATLSSNNTVAFNYVDSNLCGGIPIGSQTDWRQGVEHASGTAKLLSITVTTLGAPGLPPAHTSVTTFAYDDGTNSNPINTESCTNLYAAFRELHSIQTSAWGASAARVDLPATTFLYGAVANGYFGATQNFTRPWSAVEIQSTTGIANNLGRGYRLMGENSAEWPTVESMMIDVDGDGLIDRVYNNPIITNGHTTSCRATWERNPGPDPATGAIRPFVTPSNPNIALPTVKWANASGASFGYADLLSGGIESGMREACSLNFQATGYVNSQPGGGACSAGSTCPASGVCLNGNDCTLSQGPQGSTNPLTYISYRWMDIDNDGLIDVVASIASGGLMHYNLIQGNKATAPVPEPTVFTFPACTASYPREEGPGTYTMCGGMYPWFLYKNYGNGVFSYARTMYEPTPLETDTGESTVQGSSLVSTTAGDLDLDGDGFLDSISGSDGADGGEWHTYLGDQSGSGVLQGAGILPFEFDASETDKLSLPTYATGSGSASSEEPTTSQGLFDLNGDGLPDHWVASGSGATVALNDGMEFRHGSAEITVIAKPGNDTSGNVETSLPGINGGPYFVATGNRFDTSRTIDVDGDGRQDVATVSQGAVYVSFNQGGQFDAPKAGIAGLGFDSFYQWMVATRGQIAFYALPADTNGGPYSWEMRSDLIDLDGDGIPEGVTFGSGDDASSMMQMSYALKGQTPPRLLAEIKNGRGATTDISYTSMHDQNTVMQHPELGLISPHNTWVVKSVTVSDAISGTSATTTQQYTKPVWNADDVGRYGFRGFEQITISHPPAYGATVGSQTQNRYDFSVDWSGRPSATLTIPVEGVVAGDWDTTPATVVSSIDQTEWVAIEAPWSVAGTNFNTTTYFPSYQDHWICSSSQSEAVCTQNTTGHTRKTYSYTQFNDATAQSSVRIGTGTGGLANGDRTQNTSYEFSSTATAYRLRNAGSTSTLRSAGLNRTYAQEIKTWDASLNTLLTNQTFFDASNSATEKFDYDVYGNVLHHWKPVQNAAGGPATTYTYDAQHLFVAKEVKEAVNGVSLEFDYTYDYGTGAKVLIQGPNTRSCVSDCINDATHPAKQTQQITVDGLGRPVDTQITYADDNSDNYVLYDFDTNVYTEGAGSGSSFTPSSVMHSHRHHTDTSPWVEDRTDFDALGRPFRKTSYVQGQAPANAIATTTYSNDGTVRTVTVPNPSTNDATTVAFNYTYDSLGRPLTIQRPDAAHSGASLSYNGLTTTTTESVGTGSGNVSKTSTTHDAFGRVSEIDETISGSTVAATTYTYDNNDNVSSVTDPQGVITSMTHDFASRRTSIVRPGGTWTYGYDLNGNVSSIKVPGSSGMGDDVNYTTSIVYDNLDRPSSKVLGSRGHTSADLTLFGIGTESFTYDSGWSHLGTLRYWKSFGPGSSTPSQIVEIEDSASGAPDTTVNTYNFESYSNVTSTFAVSRYIDGTVRNTYYHDQIGGSNVTSSLSYYDYRGLPWKMDLDRTEAANQLLAYQTRNVSGAVTQRHADTTAGSMTFVESNWTYDVLGRVASQVVQQGPGPTQVAKQALTYYDNDDPKTLDHWLGATNQKHFTYTYDNRHQLAGVAETNNAFAATYGYSSAGRFSTAHEAAAALPGSDVKNRTVWYQYQGTDPEEVTSLTNGSGSGTTPFATYTYDAGGNELTRCLGTVASPCNGEYETMFYDVKDQLRRVTRTNNGTLQGSEEYWYDPNGQRVAIVKLNSAGLKTELVSFNHDAEAHYDAAGNLLHTYSYLSLGMPFARVDRTANATTAVEYQFHGLASSALAAVDQRGVTNTSFDYAPFGEVIESTDGGGSASEGVAAHRRRMNDKYFDELSDFGYYGARYYDKSSIQWTQQDPLYRFVPDLGQKAPRTANLYVFTLNNSLRYIDPDGRATTGPGRQFTAYQSEGEQIQAGLAYNMASDGGYVGRGDRADCAHFSQMCPQFNGMPHPYSGNGNDYDPMASRGLPCPPGAMCDRDWTAAFNLLTADVFAADEWLFTGKLPDLNPIHQVCAADANCDQGAADEMAATMAPELEGIGAAFNTGDTTLPVPGQKALPAGQPAYDNALRHIFQAKHNLSSLVEKMGSVDAVYSAMTVGAQQAIDSGVANLIEDSVYRVILPIQGSTVMVKAWLSAEGVARVTTGYLWIGK